MQPYRNEVNMVLELLWAMVVKHDPDGPDLYITTDMKPLKPKTDFKMLQELASRPAKDAPDIRLCFAQIIENYQNQFGTRSFKSRWRPWRATATKGPRKLSLYVLTDGVWHTKTDLRQEIRTLVAHLSEHKLTNKQIGIQFIRFGNDGRGIKRLEKLDSGLNLDLYVLTSTSSVFYLFPGLSFARTPSEVMSTVKTITDITHRDVIDTTPANGSVFKMLLGAVNESFDDDPNDEENELESEMPHVYRNNNTTLVGKGKAKDSWG